MSGYGPPHRSEHAKTWGGFNGQVFVEDASLSPILGTDVHVGAAYRGVMRYSVDVAGVAKVSSDVAVHFDTVAESVAEVLTAVDSAASALGAEASGVKAALESAMETRRLTGPGLSARAADILSGVQEASVAYVEGDDEMAVQTTSAVPEHLPGRGFGAVPQ